MRDEERERLAAFDADIRALHEELEAKLCEEDLARIKRIDRLSHGMELLGRTLIQFSLDPLTFGAGVVSLAIHKQIQAVEIGHTVLHGTYDRLPNAGRYDGKSHDWDAPISEVAWRYHHNVLHHGFTGEIGRDPDADYGLWRTVDTQELRPRHRYQVFIHFFVLGPNFWSAANFHACGIVECYTGRSCSLRDRSFRAMVQAHVLALGKLGRYVAAEYLFWPSLAGPFFPKVMFGNFLAGTIRDVFSALAIFPSHGGEELWAATDAAPPRSRGDSLRRKVEATRDIDVRSPLVRLLLGGADVQIEHHLFPKVPTDRLREIAPRVRAICQKHGVRYTSETLVTGVMNTIRQYQRHRRVRKEHEEHEEHEER